MFDNITSYYQENVVSSFVEYRTIAENGLIGSSKDLRSALTAGAALFHLREHLPAKISRSEIEKLCLITRCLGIL